MEEYESRENFQITFVERPGVNGAPKPSNFHHTQCPFPQKKLGSDSVLMKTLYLSVDPAQRCQMNESTGVEYILPWELNKVIFGLQGVGIIIESNSPKFARGDIAMNYGIGTGWPWQLYWQSEAATLIKLEAPLFQEQPNLRLSYLGVTGLTSLIGIEEKGHIKQDGDQTFIVNAAAGACGSLAGQFARIHGCKTVVGICGTDEKCSILTKELGFQYAINYKTENVFERVKSICPQGVDCFFDNVGGETSFDVIRNMNTNSHVILCGQIALYNTDVPYPPPIPKEIQNIITDRNITRERFLVLNFIDQFERASGLLSQYLASGQVKVKETISEGLQTAGEAFCGMMNGKNIGKQLVKVSSM